MTEQREQQLRDQYKARKHAMRMRASRTPKDPGDNARAFRRLAGAVLLLAIDDMTRGGVSESSDALRWMADGGLGALSFDHCCRILDRNPAGTRCDLMAMATRKTHSDSLTLIELTRTG